MDRSVHRVSVEKVQVEKSRAFPSGGHCGQEGVSTQADHQVPGLCPWKSCRHVWGWDLGPSGEK